MGLSSIILLSLLLHVSLRGLLASGQNNDIELPYPPINASDGRTPLYFSLIQSFSGQYISALSLPGLQLALDLVNDDESLLPGYSLHYVFTDAPCDKKAALNAFHRQIFEEPTKIGIIGSGCSVSTEPTASISNYYNLVHVSCIASSPAFRDRELFPRYFQLLPTDASLAIAYFGIIKFYGWQRIAIIVQMENLFTVAMDELKFLLDDTTIDYTETEIIINNDGIEGGYLNSTIEGLDNIFDEDSRIFIIHSYEPLAREIICEAYRKGYKYPQYVFFLIPWYVDGWWVFEPDFYGCTVIERAQVLEYSITVMNLPFARFINRTIVTETGYGLSVGEYFRMVDNYLNIPPLNLELYDDVAPVCYDAMWTLALAINKTIADFEADIALSDLAHEASNMLERNQTFKIENFTYQNSVVMETMFRNLEITDFIGVSGDVTFNELGIRRVTQYLILQFRRNSSDNMIGNTVAGVWSENGSLVYSEGNTEESIWPFGTPYDGVSVETEVLALHISLTVILLLFSSAGIIFSIICLIFNFYYRKQTLIKLTSPNLNYLIGSGAILLYLAIIVTVLPATTAVFASVLCNLRVWLTGFGYSLCYGTILVKMWRVYYIFSNPSTKKKNLNDWKLAMAVLCFVVIDLIMLIIFTSVEGANGRLGAERVIDKENSAITEGNQGRIKEFYVYICDSVAWDAFLGVFYGYKAILQVCGLFLAFATRKVKVRGLDDAKWIAATIYITSIVLAITILALYTLNEYTNQHSAVFTGGLFIGTTFIMAFVFVSKMYALYKDPEGKKVFDKTRPTDHPQQSNPESLEKTEVNGQGS